MENTRSESGIARIDFPLLDNSGKVIIDLKKGQANEINIDHPTYVVLRLIDCQSVCKIEADFND
jgi:hypothetical protein